MPPRFRLLPPMVSAICLIFLLNKIASQRNCRSFTSISLLFLLLYPNPERTLTPRQPLVETNSLAVKRNVTTATLNHYGLSQAGICTHLPRLVSTASRQIGHPMVSTRR